MVIPSEYEEYSGEIFDPKDAMDKIEQANFVIYSFINDMKEGRRPEADLDSIASATDVLGLYAGYPLEAANMEGYIKSDLAVSYKEVAGILSKWSSEMNALIQARVNYTDGNTKKSSNGNDAKPNNDVPF